MSVIDACLNYLAIGAPELPELPGSADPVLIGGSPVPISVLAMVPDIRDLYTEAYRRGSVDAARTIEAAKTAEVDEEYFADYFANPLPVPDFSPEEVTSDPIWFSEDVGQSEQGCDCEDPLCGSVDPEREWETSIEEALDSFDADFEVVGDALLALSGGMDLGTQALASLAGRIARLEALSHTHTH